jgi:sugar diacid utilization regulator/GAF domain-containing protein
VSLYDARVEFDVSDVLELLATKAPADHFETMIEKARRNGVAGAELATLESAVRVSLRINSQMQRSQHREAGLSALVDAARELATPYDTETLLQVITRRARHLLGLDLAYIALLDEEHGYVRVRAADGHTSGITVGLRLPADGGLSKVGQVGVAQFWTADYLADDRIVHNDTIDDVVRAEGLHAMMAVPLNYGDRLHCSQPSGMLYVASRKVRHFSADERSLLHALGNLAGMFIESARLLGESTETAAGLERRLVEADAELRVARELGEIQDRLVGLVLGGGDLHALAEEAGRLLDGGLRIQAPSGTVLTTTGDVPEREDIAEAVGAMGAHAADEPVPLAQGVWAAPVFAGNDYLGILLLRPRRELTGHGTLLLRMITRTVALLLQQNNRSVAVEGQDHEKLLDDLLAVPQHSPKLLEKRARRIGVDLDKAHLVVIARPEGNAQGRADIWAASYARRMGGLKSMRNGCAVLLLPGTDAGGVARTVLDELSSSLGQPVSVGAAGPVSGPDSVHRGYQEALRCLDAITALGVTGRAASARELGFLGVLLSDNHDVEGFIDSVLGPVLEYDRERFTDLIPTLDAYFDEGASPTYAAEKLHVHPNTVARRLERIKELLGADWQKPERVLDVQLALRLFRVRDALLDNRSPSADDLPGDADL